MTRLEEIKSKWLIFVEVEARGVTRRFSVRSRTQGVELGIVSFAPGWRQYVYDPAPHTMYSAGCLQDIEAFLLALGVERAAAKRAAGGAKL